VTAKTPDGKVIKRYSRNFMPVPARFGRGYKMGRGPYEKSGLIRNLSLLPLNRITETFIIPFYEEVKKGRKVIKRLLTKEMDIDVELWYLPFGEKKGILWDGEKITKAFYLWKKVTKKVTID